MTDYFEIYEMDTVDVQMRIFVQSLNGDVRTQFRALTPNSIDSLRTLYQKFLSKWEKIKEPLQILSDYKNLKIGPHATVQDYCTRFSSVYNSIPLDLRPTLGLALIKFPDGFDYDMAFQLRERNPPTLEDMQSIAVSIEANLLSKRAMARSESRIPLKEESSSFEQKLDAIIKGIDRLGDRVETIERKSPWDNQQTNTGRNPNFKKNQNQNTGKNGPDQNIRIPFQKNYVEASHSEGPEEDTKINLMGLDDEGEVFLSKDDQEAHILKQFQTQSGESFDFRQGYDSAIFQVHKQYNLRSRRIDVPKTNKKTVPNQPKKGKKVTKPLQILSKSNTNPFHPIIEDISDNQPNNEQPFTSIPSKESVEEPPKVDLGESANRDSNP